ATPAISASMSMIQKREASSVALGACPDSVVQKWKCVPSSRKYSVIGPNTRALDKASPARDFGRNALCESARRTGYRFHSERAQPRDDLRIAQDDGELEVKTRDDRPRRAGGRDDPVP